MRRLAILLAALLLPLAVVACGSAEEKGTGPEAMEGTTPQETETEGETEGGGEGETDTGGGGEVAEGDPAAGQEIFASQGCGGCHTFEAAGTSGTTGPNLDESQTSFDEAREQIANGGGGMPAYDEQLDEQQIADVAAFVTEG